MRFTSTAAGARAPRASRLAALSVAAGALLAPSVARAQTTVLDGAQPPPLVSTPPASAGASGAAVAPTGPSQPPAEGPTVVVVPPRVYGPRWGHRNQLSLRVAVAEGYGLGIRYAAPSDPCNASGSTFCSARAPILVDTAVGFGVTPTMEIEARFRFGEAAWNSEITRAGGLGVRFYTDDSSRLKLFGGVAFLVDFTPKGPGMASYGIDLQARGEVGLQFDVAREFGFYIGAGATAGFLRALSFGIDGGLGVQVRIP